MSQGWKGSLLPLFLLVSFRVFILFVDRNNEVSTTCGSGWVPRCTDPLPQVVLTLSRNTIHETHELHETHEPKRKTPTWLLHSFHFIHPFLWRAVGVLPVEHRFPGVRGFALETKRITSLAEWRKRDRVVV